MVTMGGVLRPLRLLMHFRNTTQVSLIFAECAYMGEHLCCWDGKELLNSHRIVKVNTNC